MPHNDVPKVKCDNCDAMLPLAYFIERPDLEDVFVSEWTCHWRRRRLCPSCNAKAPCKPTKSTKNNQNGENMIKDALESIRDSLACVNDLENLPIAELPPIIDQIRMELEHAKANIQPILENNFLPEGKWQKTGPGYYLWTGPDEPNTVCSLTIFGQQFHTLAIQTTGEDEQVALHSENQAELDALHTAGGTSDGYSEIEIDGHPAVVFLVPFDR